MSSLVSRIARPEDAPALAALVNSAYRGDSSRRGWTTEVDLVGGQRTDAATLRALLAAPGNVVLLLTVQGELHGCVLLQRKSERCAYLGMLTVRPDRQTGGLGKKLVELAESWVANTWKLPLIEMTVIQKRAELIAWYERRGYRNTGRREPFPYGDPTFGEPLVDDLEFVVLEKAL